MTNDFLTDGAPQPSSFIIVLTYFSFFTWGHGIVDRVCTRTSRTFLFLQNLCLGEIWSPSGAHAQKKTGCTSTVAERATQPIFAFCENYCCSTFRRILHLLQAMRLFKGSSGFPFLLVLKANLVRGYCRYCGRHLLKGGVSKKNKGVPLI